MSNKIPLAYADVELQLSAAISIGDTSFTLSSATDDDGNALPAGKYCFTIDNGSTQKEYLLGQLNGTTVTSVVSVSRQGVEASGAARAHRVGASAILSDFATIQRVADILRGQETLDGDNPVVYDAEPTLTDRKEVATVAYVLDNVVGGTVAFDSQIVTGVNAGETVSAGELVYFKTSDQEWYLADADTASTVNGVQMGIALGAGTDGASITGGVQISGSYTTTGLTAGSPYYAGNTPGVYTTGTGTTQRVIGVALSTTELLLVPVSPESPTSDEKDAMAGSSGTPSSTNTFITEDDVDTANTGSKLLRLTNGAGISKKITTSASTTEIADNTTTETNIFQQSVPANLLGTSNALKFRIYTSNTSFNGTLTFRLKYGSTTLVTLTTQNVGATRTDFKGYVEGVLIANGASAQQGVMEYNLSQTADDPDTDYATNTALFVREFGSGTAAEDSTGALNLTVSIQWSAASADNDFVPAGYLVELVS